MHLEIIVGTSIFSNRPLVGVAFRGAQHGIAVTKWAEEVAGSRPAGVETFGGNHSEESTITYLADKWQDWADRYNVQLTINRKPRRVLKPF